MEAVTPKLMLVENDPYFIYLLRLYAEQSGFLVISTNSGLGAVTMAQQECPAVILLELELPEVTGWEVLHELRSEPLTEAIPVVLCVWQDSEDRCDVGHLDGLLHKPLQYEDFVAALKGVGVWPGDGSQKPRRSSTVMA